jgi:hypothetical protein
VAILDTKTWTWTIPTIGGIPPSRRSLAAAGILDGKHLTVAFGNVNIYLLSTYLLTYILLLLQSSCLYSPF